MHPSTLIRLDKLPVTANGKADRKQLEQCALELQTSFFNSTPPTVTRTGLENIVTRCWSEVLSIPVSVIPLDRDFYECGGDSISIIRLAVAMRAAGLHVKASSLRKTTTVAGQARLARECAIDDIQSEDQQAYQPFCLVPGVSVDAVAELLIGYDKGAIEDIYPTTSTISGLVSLATTSPTVRIHHQMW